MLLISFFVVLTPEREEYWTLAPIPTFCGVHRPRPNAWRQPDNVILAGAGVMMFTSINLFATANLPQAGWYFPDGTRDHIFLNLIIDSKLFLHMELTSPRSCKEPALLSLLIPTPQVQFLCSALPRHLHQRFQPVHSVQHLPL